MGFIIGLIGSAVLHILKVLTLIFVGFTVGALTGIGVTYVYTFVLGQNFELVQGAWMGSILGIVAAFLRYTEYLSNFEP